MELGNVMFGNSRGSYHIERGTGFEEELQRLFQAYAPDRDNSWREYGVNFENEVFHVFPYYWGDCTCLYEEAAYQWSETNKHTEQCYQSEARRAMERWDVANNYKEADEARSRELYTVETTEEMEDFPGMTAHVIETKETENFELAHKHWCELYEKRRKEEDRVWQELCAKHSIAWNEGRACAIHCTCTHEADWSKWASENGHARNCPIIRPNFLHKPSGFELCWYKYPLRDSYMSQELTLGQFTKLINECIASVSASPSPNCGGKPKAETPDGSCENGRELAR